MSPIFLLYHIDFEYSSILNLFFAQCSKFSCTSSDNSCSIFNNLLYFATLSVLQGAPVFICPAFIATLKSAMLTSSVSPERCDIIVLYPFFFANSIVSPAMEYKSEGYVMGVGGKMFTVAGPVLVFGISASILVGIVFLIFNTQSMTLV